MIVPVFNGEPFIMQFFNSIRIDIAKHGIEIIFVDNGSIDKTNEMLVNLSKPHKNIRVLKYEDKQSSYAARNEGARNARGDIFLFTDIDCILTKSYFKTIINNEFNDSYSLVSGPIEVSIHLNNIYEYFDKAAYLDQSKYHKKNYAATANLIVSRQLFETVNGFPEFISGGDNKFCKNCFKSSNKTSLNYKKDLIVMHPARNSFSEHIVKASRLGKGHGQFFLETKPNNAKKLFFVIKHIIGMIFSLNIIKVYVLAIKYSRPGFNKKYLHLLFLCWFMPFIQRKNAISMIFKS